MSNNLCPLSQTPAHCNGNFTSLRPRKQDSLSSLPLYIISLGNISQSPTSMLQRLNAKQMKLRGQAHLFFHPIPIRKVGIPFQAWQANNTWLLMAFTQITHWLEVPCSRSKPQNQKPPLLSSILLLNLGEILKVSTPSTEKWCRNFAQVEAVHENRVLMICSKKLTLFETYVGKFKTNGILKNKGDFSDKQLRGNW